MSRSWFLIPRTVLLALSVLVWGTLSSLGAIIAAVRDPKGTRANAVQVLFSRGILFMSGVRVIVSGRDRVPPGGVVLMSNHRSHFDVPALVAALPELRLRWVAKKELGRIPVFGWAMRAAGHILVDRQNRARAIESLAHARRALERGAAVVVFPEGTRSPDSNLLPFKRGGFHLAVQAGLPILPVALAGSETVLPKHRWTVRRGVIHVEILDPVASEDFSGAELNRLVALVRARLESALARRSSAAPA